MTRHAPRERWKLRIGVVLAMAGSAVGLGNFLRFPVQAARNGGGAFMIPYFVAFLVMGIPLMWMEWAQGRYGGHRGHGTTPGMFQLMWKHPIAKYLGVLGLFTPTVIMIYYTYVESWTLGYSVLHLLGRMPDAGTSAVAAFEGFNQHYVGQPSPAAPDLLEPSVLALGFFVLTLGMNVWILDRGIAGGIEVLSNVAMPLLGVFAVILAVWALTLSPHVASPIDGLGFLWNPDFAALSDPGIWLAAAGQVFFTLNLGMGAIQCYASYLREDEDVMLTGLGTCAANEFTEVVLGGAIAIPAAVTFFGLVETQRIAESGSFYLGFVSMPAIFATSPSGAVLGGLWFALLFMAGIMSSVAMAQPLLAFVQEEFHVPRRRAAIALGALFFVTTNLCIWLRGALDVMDFWAGTFAPLVLALIEAILLMWIFGAQATWDEMHRSAELRAPRFFFFAAKWVMPLFLSAILLSWMWTNLLHPDPVKGIEAAGGGVGVWVARVFLLLLLAGLCALVRMAWQRRVDEGRTGEEMAG